MIIKVRSRHFYKATYYNDSQGCPLAQALAELYGKNVFSVGSQCIVDCKNIHTTMWFRGWTEQINPFTSLRNTSLNMTGREINSLINHAQAGGYVATIEVEVSNLINNYKKLSFLQRIKNYFIN